MRKCPYCDFNSYTLSGELPEAAYIEALLRDLHAQAAAGRRAAKSSACSSAAARRACSRREAIGRLLEAARRELRLAADVEITLEANPGTIERGRFAEYRAAGIKRVSLGAQSFDARAAAGARPHPFAR